MKTLYTLVLLLLVPVPLWAENAPAPVEPAAQETPAVGPIAAADVMLDELMFLRRPGGQAQFSALLTPEPSRVPRLAALLEWIPLHLHADLSLAVVNCGV